MSQSFYGERDYVFDQRMLNLHTYIKVTRGVPGDGVGRHM